MASTPSSPVYFKFPVEVRDFDLPFADDLTAKEDTPVSFSASADTGLTVKAVELLPSGDVRVFTSGGISGYVYRIAADMLTAAGRLWRKQAWIQVRGKDPTGPSLSSDGLLLLDNGALLLGTDYLVLASAVLIAGSVLLLDSTFLFLDSNLLVLA